MVWFGLEGSRFKTINDWKRLWSQRWKRLWSHKGGYRAARAAKKRRRKNIEEIGFGRVQLIYKLLC